MPDEVGLDLVVVPVMNVRCIHRVRIFMLAIASSLVMAAVVLMVTVLLVMIHPVVGLAMILLLMVMPVVVVISTHDQW